MSVADKPKSIHTATEPAICPVCTASFLVSSYRLENAKSTPCCSRPCSYAHRKQQASSGQVPWKTSRHLDDFEQAVETMPVSLVSSWWRFEHENGHPPHVILSRLNLALGTKYGTNSPSNWVVQGNLPRPVRRYMLGLVMRQYFPSHNFEESLLDRLL